MENDKCRAILEQCIRRELRPGRRLPGLEEDLVDCGALDSMGWVSVLQCLESAFSIPNLTELLEDSSSRSTRSLVNAVVRATSIQQNISGRQEGSMTVNSQAAAGIVGWGWAVGSECVDVARVEKEFGLSPGRIRERAGIESVARVAPGENELTLAALAAESALERSGADFEDIDWIIASSETMLAQPSLGAALHSRLLLRESCGTLDVGGACLGLLNCLRVAQALIAGGSVRHVLVVTADVHSSRLLPGIVPPTFGALFGDGASAFLLRRVETGDEPAVFRLGEFQFGCVGTHATALQFGFSLDGKVALNFDGEALAHAAVSRLKKVVEDVALRSGVALEAAGSFAIHQPNPRLVELFARQAQIPPAKIPKVSNTYGNLGTSTCGVALGLALDQAGSMPSETRGPVFLAAVAPGLIWGGGLLYG